MISEKTVELNVTAELLAWLGYVTGQTYVALAPSQRQEGRLGYDASFHGGGRPVALIQFKRAYVDGTVWQWHLNRTSRRDQHARLQHLEAAGFPVLYAFPFFATPAELRIRRRQLLVSTFWYPPSFITPTGPPNAHHEVCFDTATGRWWVKSADPVDIRPPLPVGVILNPFYGEPRRIESLEQFVEGLNEVLGYFDQAAVDLEQADQESIGRGQALLISYGE